MAQLIYKQAEALARAWVEICVLEKSTLVLEHTITKPYGWVFFYQSCKWLETRKLADSLVGNSPILIDSANGEIILTGTARPVEHYLKAYEAMNPTARSFAKPLNQQASSVALMLSRLIGRK